MTKTSALNAQKREVVSKGATKALRLAGKVPAIIYGGKEKELMASIERKELVKELNKGGFESKIVEINLDGSKVLTLPRDIQFHPVTDEPQHADFMRVSKDSEINVWVKVVFLNKEKCPGLKLGGILNIVRHEVELICKVDSIPEQIEADLLTLDIGDSVHIKDIKLPEGVTPEIDDRNFTIATIAGRAKEEEETTAVVDAASVPLVGEEEGAEGDEGEAAEGADDAKAKAKGKGDEGSKGKK